MDSVTGPRQLRRRAIDSTETATEDFRETRRRLFHRTPCVIKLTEETRKLFTERFTRLKIVYFSADIPASKLQ